MKTLTLFFTAAAGLIWLALATPSIAADQATGKEITITGEAKCTMCQLKESDKCQTVIQTEKEGKKVSYYLADNDVAKNFHDKICKSPKKVTATGTVAKVDGKHQMTVSKIELVK